MLHRNVWGEMFNLAEPYQRRAHNHIIHNLIVSISYGKEQAISLCATRERNEHW